MNVLSDSLPSLNPAQQRLLQRHIDRAVSTLEEADRLLGGLVTDAIARCIGQVRAVMGTVEAEETPMQEFLLEALPEELVPYLDNPFAQGISFNLYCLTEDVSHTKGGKTWRGGNGAIAARNLPFLPPIFAQIWEDGLLDKTRLIAIANRNLKEKAYLELAEVVRTHRKEDLDDRLLKLPADYHNVGRRGPEQAVEAAENYGWLERFKRVRIAEELVKEAREHAAANAGKGANGDENGTEESEPTRALKHLRAGLGGIPVAPEVVEALHLSPDPVALVEKFLTAHRKAGDPDPDDVTKTLFFAHAGPIQKIAADDKFLLRHFRPVKTQKRGQLFYAVLEAIEEVMRERSHLSDLEARGIDEDVAKKAVHDAIHDLNKQPNHYLTVPDEWLGEVTRRHLYFGSRTRKEGAAYKWFRKIGTKYFLGNYKTPEEIAEKEARKKAKA